MKGGKQLSAGVHKSCWCAARSATTSPPLPSSSVQLESGVRGNSPASFGAGERPQGPTYRYKPVYNILESKARFTLLVANAQHLKAVPGRKTDVKSLP